MVFIVNAFAFARDGLWVRCCWRWCCCCYFVVCFPVRWSHMAALALLPILFCMLGSATNRVRAHTYASGGYPLPNFEWRRFIFRADKHFTSSSTLFFPLWLLQLLLLLLLIFQAIRISNWENFCIWNFSNQMAVWVKRDEEEEKSSKQKWENRKIKTIYTRIEWREITFGQTTAICINVFIHTPNEWIHY